MGQAIGGILPLAIAVDISVLSIIAVILMLITPRARSNGPAFVAGWVLGLVVVGGLVLFEESFTSDAAVLAVAAVAFAVMCAGVVLLTQTAPATMKADTQTGRERRWAAGAAGT